MARWTASAKWAAGPALDGQRDMPLALRLSEGLDEAATRSKPLMRPVWGRVTLPILARESVQPSEGFPS